MILRRFMKHMTDQNWFAVGLDVIVVIVGIFLGLQVQNWYEVQNEKAEEVRVISDLISDVEENVGYLESQFSVQTRFSVRNARVLEILENGELAPEDVDFFERSLRGFSTIGPIDFVLDSINEDTQDKIREEEIRRVITRYIVRMDANNTAINRILERIDAGRMITSSKAAFANDSNGGIMAFYDFNRLKDDYEFRAAIINIYDAKLRIDRRIGMALEMTQKLVAALKQYQAGQVVEEVDF